MKKIINILILSIIILVTITLPVIASSTVMNKLRLTVLNADETHEVFMLLPKKYIMYAINHDGLDIDYDSANTLIYNNIPSITVDINDVLEDTYIEDHIEYVQIQLHDLGGEEYLFEIIPEYTDMDMLFRVKSQSRDNLLVIENFKMRDNTCNIEYDYEQNTVKTERKSEIQFRFHLSWWQIVVIALLTICLVFLNNKGRY